MGTRRKYLAFDIETEKLTESDWRSCRPLGISRAATLPADREEPTLWHGGNDRTRPADRMSREEAAETVEYLTTQVAQGYTLVTWNGVGFDFVDAGWFGGEPWWKNCGNWRVRPDLYPQGFRPLSDPLHQSDRRLLLWFEPQRVCRGTEWAKFCDRPGWLLELGAGVPEYKQHNMDWKLSYEDPRWVLWESRRSQIGEDDLLWNMGEPSAE